MRTSFLFGAAVILLVHSGGVPVCSAALPAVPGCNVEVYAELDLPAYLCFAPGGVMYVGHGDNDAPVSVYRIEAGGGPGSVSPYGPPLGDPDAIGYDETGLISGTPGAVLTGGGIYFPRHFTAILPDRTATKLWDGPFSNPSDIAFDSTGRMLLLDPTSAAVYQSRGERPTVLFQCPQQDGLCIALDQQDNIFISIGHYAAAKVLAYHPDGSAFANNPIAENLGTRSPNPLAFGTGGFWGSGLYVIANHMLMRFDSPLDSPRTFTTVGTGFSNGYNDMEFGPDGALYISDWEANRILRISPPAGDDLCTLTISLGNGGSATVRYSGHYHFLDHCGATLSITKGEEVKLEGIPDIGYEFTRWTASCFGTSERNSASIIMDADCDVTANFKRIEGLVVIRASGAAPNYLSKCFLNWGLSFLREARKSGYPDGLIMGTGEMWSEGVCDAEYHFPIIKTREGINGLTKVSVYLTGSLPTDGSQVYIGTLGPYKPTNGNLHEDFIESEGIGKILKEDPSHPIYWLTVRIDGDKGRWDLHDVYVCYECPNISPTLLQTFNDHFSIYQALHNYATDPKIRKLYGSRSNDERVWEGVAQTLAYAQDLTEAGLRGTFWSAGKAFDRFDNLLDLLLDAADLAFYRLQDYPSPYFNKQPEDIPPCLDLAVSSGAAHITGFAKAIADGRVSQEENDNIVEKMGSWTKDLKDMNSVMTSVFDGCNHAYWYGRDNKHEGSCKQAELMIRCMMPWIIGELDKTDSWQPDKPTYLDKAIETLASLPEGFVSPDE
jgi:sugar lactone lactonase YvrE